MIDVPVLRAFTHEGRALAPGDIARMSPFAAAVLHRQGYVSLTRIRTAHITPEPEPEPVPDPTPKRRRRYRRRDLTAETA